MKTTDKFQPGSDFGAANRLESAVKDLMEAQENVSRAISKLHQYHTGECSHETNLDTSTMGGPKSFHCVDCQRDFIIVEE